MITDLGLTAAGQVKLGTPDRVIVLGNGDILVAGTQGVARLLPTGSLDPAFGHNGYAPVGFPFGGFAATNVTVSGVISRVEARLQGRRGPRIMQPCYDLANPPRLRLG